MRSETKQDRIMRLGQRLESLGFAVWEVSALIRIERILSRWSELECGDGNDYGSWAIERDEATGKPYMVHHHYTHGGKDYTTRTPIADRESGALKRLNKIMAAHPECIPYNQGDPRGYSLYIVPKAELKGRDLDSCYTVGVAVYV